MSPSICLLLNILGVILANLVFSCTFSLYVLCSNGQNWREKVNEIKITHFHGKDCDDEKLIEYLLEYYSTEKLAICLSFFWVINFVILVGFFTHIFYLWIYRESLDYICFYTLWLYLVANIFLILLGKSIDVITKILTNRYPVKQKI